MHKRIFPIIILFLSSCLFAIGQNNTPITLKDFAGTWKADMEKSFSRSERRRMTDYKVKISESDRTLQVFSEFMDDGIRTRINDVYTIDGKEHSLKGKYLFSDLRAYSGKLKGTTVKVKFHQSLEKNTTVYLDQRTFALSPDKKALTIETVRRSARSGDAANSDLKRLVLLREE